MWIESLVVQGFRSFGDETKVIFDKGHTAIFGRNGSGKSNLLAALSFVLQAPAGHRGLDVFPSVQGNEGPLQASIEVVINDDDGRVAGAESGEDRLIKIRRTMGHKKDTFIIGNKTVTPKDVLDLLSSAGVLTSNPYHFVRQGEINSLAEASPMKRLKLLEDFAGTTVHKEKRALALQFQSDTAGKLREIETALEELEKEIRELEGECEDLAMYTNLEKQLHTIQLVLHTRDRQKLESKLEEFETTEVDAKKLKNELTTVSAKLKISTEKLNDDLEREKQARSNIESLRMEHDSAIHTQSSVEEKIRDLTEKLVDEEAKQTEAEAYVFRLKLVVEEKQAELAKYDSVLEKKRGVLEEVKNQLVRQQKRMEVFHILESTRATFDNDKLFEEWLNDQVKVISQQISEQNDRISKFEENLIQKRSYNEDLQKKMDECQQKFKEIQEAHDNHSVQSELLRRSINELRFEQVQMSRKIVELQQEVETAKKKHFTAEQEISRIPWVRNLVLGLRSVEKILNHLKQNKQDLHIVEGVYGCVSENFGCEEAMATAISATIGKQLLYLIVKDHQVVKGILHWQKCLHLPGEITFLTISLIKPRTNYKYINNSDFRPMIDKVNYDSKFENIFKFLFGGIMVTRSMENFSQVQNSKGINFVTLDGQQASGRGVMTGGYYDKSKVLLVVANKYFKARDERFKLEAELSACVEQSQLVDKKNQNFLDKFEKEKYLIDRCQVDRTKVLGHIDRLKDEIKNEEQQMGDMTSQLQKKRLDLAELEEHLTGLNTNEESSEEVKELMNDIRTLSKVLKSKTVKLTTFESSRNAIKNELECQDVPMLKDAEQRANVGIISQMREQLITARETKARIAEEIPRLQDELKSLETIVNDLIECRSEVAAKVNSLTEDRDALKIRLQDCQDRNAVKIQQEIDIKNQIDQINAKISDFAILIPETCKFAEFSNKKCHKMLEKLVAKLNKVGTVNKNAKAQFEDGQKKMEDFRKRKSRLDADHIAASNLVDLINQKKREKLHLTRLQVSKYFQEIFAFLVPGGEGELHFETRGSVASINTTSNDQSSTASSDVPNEDDPIGLKIFVKFSNQSDFCDMTTLSGGQKSVVALAFIFAIQKCDPAPFYIFDEVDAALDVGVRGRIAEWLDKTKEEFGTQFIVTTFRKEILERADKFVRVQFGNRNSMVEEVTRQEAGDFIANI